MFLTLCCLVLILCAVYLVKLQGRPRGYPPGPKWQIFFDNVRELRKVCKEVGGQHLAFEELARRHETNVLGLKLGKELIVVVLSYDVVKKVLTSEEYEGRPDNFFIRLRTMGTRKGITCTDGHLWQTHRSFLVRHLRNLGFGKKPMERMVKDELTSITALLDASAGRGVAMRDVLAPAVLNVLWHMTAGSRLDAGDARLTGLLDLLDERMKVFDMSGGMLSHYPWLRFVAPEMSGYNLVKALNGKLRGLFMEVIEQHVEEWVEGREDDFIFSFLTEMKKGKEGEGFDYDQLVMVCLDIFLAGAQTTSNTLNFAFMVMVLRPDIQEKVYECIQNAFGATGEFDYNDRHKVPYVEAVLLEVTRMYGVVPVNGPRRVLRDTTLEGYFIPKETTVLISLNSVHMDPCYWKDPKIFRPERFLNANGQLTANERVIPFGLGKRRCLGELLARSCMFNFFTGILQKFAIKLENGAEPLKGVAIPGLTLRPEPYSAVFVRRDAYRNSN